MSEWRYLSKHISLLYRYNQAAIARQLEPVGLGLGQHSYVLAVCEKPGISQDKLTGILMYNKSTVARAIAHLEKNGFLERRTDPADKRSYRLYPTQKGEEARAEILRRLEELSLQLVEGLDTAEREQAMRLLERMAENAVGRAAEYRAGQCAGGSRQVEEKRA